MKEKWMAERYPIAVLLDWARTKGVPQHRHSVWYSLGGMLLFLLGLQVVTGIMLAFYYHPTEEGAYGSILKITGVMPFGWAIRSMHAWTATAMIAVAFAHLFSVWILRSFRKPRELTWVSGVLLLGLLLGFGFSGYLLPWNELSFFATKVGTKIVGSIPVVGYRLMSFLRGGDEVTGDTISRFFAFHICLLPLSLAALAGLHVLLIQIQGMSVPPGVEAKGQKCPEIPFFPDFLLHDLRTWAVLLGALVTLAVAFPGTLGNPADPLAPAPPGIRPEWYFLSLYQVLKWMPTTVLGIEGEVVGAMIFVGVGVTLVALPFVFRGRLCTALAFAALIFFVVFTVVGYISSEREKQQTDHVANLRHSKPLDAKAGEIAKSRVTAESRIRRERAPFLLYALGLWGCVAFIATVIHLRLAQAQRERQAGVFGAILLAAFFLCATPSLAQQAPESPENKVLTVDDFASGKLSGWQFSSSTEYYKGGFGATGLSVVQDPERKANVLKAHVAFKNATATETAFITKMLTDRPLLQKCATVSFWYKITTAKLDKERGLVCRLRTSDTTFTDYAFGQGGALTPGRWQHVEIDVARPKRIVNIYTSFFNRTPIREITFRLDDEDAENVEFDFFVADIRLHMKEAREEAGYEPVVRPREPHRGTNVLVITQSAASYYGVEAAARSLPEAGEVKRLLFRGLHFPIFDFPQDFAGLSRYDIVAMIDVDPYVFTLDQVRMLCDFVASGGGLFFAGGPNTLGAAQDFKRPLRDILPVTFSERSSMPRPDAAPTVMGDHPAVRGLNRLGKVNRMNAVAARAGSTTLLSLSSTKPRSWGWYTGGGKNDAALSQSAEPHAGKASACLELKDFYKDPKTGAPAWVGVALIQGDSNGYAGGNAYPAKPNCTYRFSFWAKGNVPKFRVECLSWKTDEATQNNREHIKTTLGEIKPGNEWTRYEGTFATTAKSRKLVLSFTMHESPKSVKLGEKLFVDDVELTEQGKTQNLLSNPGAEEDTSVPVMVAGQCKEGRLAVLAASPDMAETTEGSLFTSEDYPDLLRQTLAWLAKREQDVRIKPGLRAASLRPAPSLHPQIEFAYGKAAFAPGSQMNIAVRMISDPPATLPGSLALKMRICDASNATVHEFPPRQPATEAMQYEYTVPELEKGEYKVVADRLDQNTRRAEAQAGADFSVVDRLDMNEFYPIISWLGANGGEQTLDEAGLRERVDDLIAHGFNTIAIGGGKIFAATPLSNSRRLLNFAERYAQSRGMGVIYEYTRFTDIAHDKPAPVCPFSPDYAKNFERSFETDMAVCQATPRLISFKILDEPTASEASVDFCAHCQAAYRQKYGMALRRLKEIPQEALLERLYHNEFVSDYASAGYRTGYDLMKRRGCAHGLLLTYMSTIAGYSNIDRSQEDAYGWSRYADYIDFDVYPYFYPDSDKVRMVKAHWVFAYLRAVAAQWRKPMGFYVELDDRNYPFQINPVKASSECAYTAIGQGCSYLNSFINTAFGTGTSARPERWEDCGREMQKIASIAPLLKKTARPPAEVAVYFPHTQWYVQAKSYAPIYAHQLALRAFGECDILHEKVLRERGTAELRAILLIGVDLLPDDCAEKLLAFVRGGGTLIADRVPSRNQTGAACRLPKDLFGGEETALSGTLKLSHRKEGQGQTFLFSEDMDKMFKDAVEVGSSRSAPTPDVREALLRSMRDLLLRSGAKAHAWADSPEFETDVRIGRNTAVLVAINHAPETGRAKVQVGNLGFTPGYVCDLVTGEKISARLAGEQTTIDLELADRSARLIGLYPEAVTGHELEIDSPRLTRGGRLKYTIRVKSERAAQGQHIIAVTVTDSNGTVQPRYGGLLVTTDGTLTREVPLAVNAAKGQWTIAVRDRYTEPNSTRSFRVE